MICMSWHVVFMAVVLSASRALWCNSNTAGSAVLCRAVLACWWEHSHVVCQAWAVVGVVGAVGRVCDAHRLVSLLSLAGKFALATLPNDARMVSSLQLATCRCITVASPALVCVMCSPRSSLSQYSPGVGLGWALAP